MIVFWGFLGKLGWIWLIVLGIILFFWPPPIPWPWPGPCHACNNSWDFGNLILPAVTVILGLAGAATQFTEPKAL